MRWPGAARRALHVAFVVALVSMPERAAGQRVDVGEPLEDYLRVLQISGQVEIGSFSLRPLLLREDATGSIEAPHPWARTLGRPASGAEAPSVDDISTRLRFFLNSRQPMVQNDGSVWQGKGVTTALDLGATLSWRALRVTIAPTLLFTQNASFELAPVTVAGMPEYAYPWRRMDLPQRFGPDPFWRLDPGQSEIRISAYGGTVGFGTRNRWWGPGIRNAIVLSNNAGGFPHAFLGTRGPRDVGIGTVEATWIFGRLDQTDWFDPSVERDARFLTGVVVAFSPAFLDGLSLGATRAFYGSVPESGQPFSDVFLIFQGVSKEGLVTPGNPTGDDDKDQLLSLFGRWVLPESGFEVYFEWARNDHSGSLYDFALEPEHSQAYTLGLQKAVELESGDRLALRGELTHLAREATFRLRPSPVYYTHHIVVQGYTHRGEVLGAGIGPGGIQQHLGADLYTSWGRAGLSAQRRVHDNDAFYAWAEATGATYDQHDVSLDFGVSALVFAGDVDLGGALTLTRELNRYFFGPHVTNLNVALSARWRPGAR